MSIETGISAIESTIRTITPLDAIKPQAAETAQQADPGFASILKAKLDEMIEMHNDAEVLQQDLIAGKTDNIAEVVLGMQRADLALTYAIELRNKIIEAYQDISRTQI